MTSAVSIEAPDDRRSNGIGTILIDMFTVLVHRNAEKYHNGEMPPKVDVRLWEHGVRKEVRCAAGTQAPFHPKRKQYNAASTRWASGLRASWADNENCTPANNLLSPNEPQTKNSRH